MLFVVILERLSDFSDGDVQRLVTHHSILPYRILDLLPTDDLVGVFGKIKQQFHAARFEFAVDVILKDPRRIHIDLPTVDGYCSTISHG